MDRAGINSKGNSVNRTHLIVGVLALVVGMPTLGWAQPDGPGRDRNRGGRGRFSPTGGTLNLLSEAEVAKALELTDEQKGFLAILKEESTKEDEEFFASLEDVSREERMEKAREYMTKRGPEIESSVKEILGDDKLKRFKQIRLQISGVMSLMSPDVAKEVGLTEDQLSQMRSTMRETFMQRRGEGRGAPDPVQFAEARKEMEGKLLGMLTDPQKERWTEMQGPPANIDLDKLREGMFRGGFPGGGRRPGRDQNRPTAETAPRENG